MRVRAAWGAVVIACALAAAPAGARAPSCAERGSSTVASNSLARVYYDVDERLMACSKRDGLRNELVHGTTDEAWAIVLRGEFVAYGYHHCEPTGIDCTRRVRVDHVRRERHRFDTPAAPTKIVLRSNGSVAWGEDQGDWGEVYRQTRRGMTRLDSGRRVDPESLRLQGRKLSWRNAGRVRRATLR